MSGRTPITAPVTTDPWAAFGSIVSGVAVYGLVGWGLGQWLGARWLLPVGIVAGAVLGTYMVVARFKVGMAALDGEGARTVSPSATPTDRQPASGPTENPVSPTADGRPAEELRRER